MNKRIMILVGIVICMLLNVMKPTVVNALENVLVEENPIVEGTSEEVSEQDEVESEKKTDEKDETIKDETTEKKTDEKDETESEDLTEKKDEVLNDTKSEKPVDEQDLTKEEPVEQKVDTPNEGESEEPVQLRSEQPTDETKAADDETEIVSGEIYDIQKVRVIITKVDEEENMLAGAKLQLKDAKGNILDEWTSTTEAHEVQLPNGTYYIHEVEAPEGYELAEDKEFTVTVEIADLDSGVDFSTTPCSHYGGTPLYYVQIEGKPDEKYEVYCINQDLETPDENSNYDGKILTSTDIRDYTQQTVYSDAHGNKTKTDVSDQSLNSEELYNKILDIIYRRHKATNKFEDLTEAEIRYVTESALKNYTNAGLTRVQRVDVGTEPNNYDKYDAYTTDDGKYTWYLYPWYRSFVYDPDAPVGTNIFHMAIGSEEADAFGNLARHWNGSGHNARTNTTTRSKVARYYELYLYLINGSDVHPDDMHLYIYSTTDKVTDEEDWSDYDFDKGAYQNLLGITGYFEEIDQQEQEVKMVNKYSTETVEVTIKKVWNDNNNQDGKRPESLTVTLNNGTSVTLNEANGWTATIKDLPKYDKGKLITYTWKEISLPNGYTLTSNETNGYVTTLTNTYTPEVTSIKVTKVWADDENESNKRPENVTITLLANGKEYDTIVLSEENEWKYEFTDLPVYNAGEKITWDVREENVPEGYVSAVEYDETKGFIIHNVLGQGGEEPPPENPQTGDNVILYLLMMIISIIGFVSGKMYLRENN